MDAGCVYCNASQESLLHVFKVAHLIWPMVLDHRSLRQFYAMYIEECFVNADILIPSPRFHSFAIQVLANHWAWLSASNSTPVKTVVAVSWNSPADGWVKLNADGLEEEST
ncbi:hypothetical protein GH714_033883 [Hevea brasiliensis]|uniref:Uncharacterized protein n=1 Tax=Hevea brasiliensis TaxID=3981 RepID=A0A6A6LLC7_HEVBR|nr:hypothetical protein GH714_033883 [Hevea brasiliensis]